MARGNPGIPRKHPSDCRCVFHTGRMNHKDGCQCIAHSGKHRRGDGNRIPYPVEYFLVRDRKRGKAQDIKRKLIDANIKQDSCEECGLGSEWNGEHLVLQLDHINGINTDWRLENLKVICPNCHTQTKTFAGRNNRGSTNGKSSGSEPEN